MYVCDERRGERGCACFSRKNRTVDGAKAYIVVLLLVDGGWPAAL